MPLVLGYLILWGYDFYHYQFFALNLTLLLASAFCLFTALLIKRKDLAAVGIVLFISMLVLLQNQYEASFYTLASVLIICATVAYILFWKWHEASPILTSEKVLDFLLVPVVLTFALVSFAMGFGQAVWQVHLVLGLALLFFAAKFYLTHNPLDFQGILVFVLLNYFLAFCQRTILL